MNRLRAGMRVYAVHDERIGEVRSVNACCFEVLVASDSRKVLLTPKAIFNVVKDWATLVCDRDGMSRYECKETEHPAAVDEAKEV